MYVTEDVSHPERPETSEREEHSRNIPFIPVTEDVSHPERPETSERESQP